MPRKFSFDFPDDLGAKVVEESDRKKVTYADVIRLAVEEYFQRDRQRQNLEVLLSEIHAAQFESVKTRAVVLRCFDMTGKELSDEMLEEAGKDAEEYIKQRRNGS